MSQPLIQSGSLFDALDASENPAPRPGFRLARLEVLNWGTFHQHVWGLDLGGSNALLTGDIGSGKSTLVDAITALMVPRANFNKAAGAATGERTTETYFFGRYKSERGEPGLSSKPVSLRAADSYSVILGRFVNEALGQQVTLAQVFWAKAPQGPPARLFVIADSALSITEHLSGFGQDINTLKKRLRKLAQVEVYDAFAPYGSAYRHRFGIDNEQAMDLFHQTISMKSVGNLTDFVRDAREVRPFVRVAAVASEREAAGVVGATVLPRYDVFDMKRNERRRLLRHAAILTRVACTHSNNVP